LEVIYLFGFSVEVAKGKMFKDILYVLYAADSLVASKEDEKVFIIVS